MFAELAKPVTLIFCILSLYGVFHTAFLLPASDIEQRLSASVETLALAAGIAFISGLIFRESAHEHNSRSTRRSTRLTATLPVQVFCWASSLMLILFLVSWYLESHCIFYRDIRFY